MTLLRRASAMWNALWIVPASPYPVAAFRILLGFYLCVYFGTLAPHVEVLFSSHGVYAPYLVPDYAPSPSVAHLLFACMWLACAALMLGLRSGLAIPVLLALYLYHYFLALGVKHSTFERLIVIYLVSLWPNQPDAVWALSRARNNQVHTRVFTERLMCFQAVVLYLGAGLWKAFNPAWQSGVLLKATLHGLWATPLAFSLVRLGITDTQWTLLSWGIIAGEIALGLCLFFRRTRLVGVVLGTLFHAANATILSIPEFLVCLTPYVFFLPADQVQRAGERVLARLRSPRSAPR